MIKRWILLRGLARGRGHWGSFSEKIQAQFPQDEFEFLDLPGNGERCDEDSPTHVEEFVKDLRCKSRFVAAGQKFQILAVSLGGMIAVEWMRAFPGEVEKLFLICTSSSGVSPFHERFLLSNYPAAVALAFKKDPEVWEDVILKLVTNNQERRSQERPALLQYSQKHLMRVPNVLNQLIAASRYHMPKQPPGEIVLLGSHGDHLVSPQCTLKLARAWSLKPQMHPWAGHDIPIDDPQWVLEHLI